MPLFKKLFKKIGKDIKKVGGAVHKVAKPGGLMKRKKGSVSPSPEVAEKAMGG